MLTQIKDWLLGFVRHWTVVEVVNNNTFYRLRTDGVVWQFQAIGGLGDNKWYSLDKFPSGAEASIFWSAISA